MRPLYDYDVQKPKIRGCLTRQALTSKPKGARSVNEMSFAILGPAKSAAGKTTLLACMAEEGQGDASERLILFVPIKCEKYLESPEERYRLHKAVKKAFEKTLLLTSNPLYRDRLAMALLPVQTVGGAKFRRFKIAADGRIEREVYRKDLNSKFSPKNVDQPMRYLMSFLLEQFAQNKKNGSWYDKFLSFIFREGDLKEVAEYIRSDIKSDNDLEAGFEIFCGRNLIGLPSR